MPLFVGTRHVRRYAPSSSSSGGGATPTYVATGTLVQSAGVENPTLEIPYYAGLAANDIAIVQVGGYPSGVGDYGYPTVSGWTLIGNQQASAGTSSQGIYYKRLTGSESGTEAFTLSTTSELNITLGCMFGIRGCITSGTPYEDFDVASAASGTSATSASITTLGNNRLCLRLQIDEDAGGSSVPASWTQRHELTDTVLNAITTTLDTLAQASTGTVSASTRTLTGSVSWVIHTLAMIPT